MRVTALTVALTACAGEWKQTAVGGPLPTQTCDEARERGRERSTGPLITGYVMIGAGAAAGIAAIANAIYVSSVRSSVPDDLGISTPSYAPAMVLGAAALALVAIGAPLSYQGYSDRFDEPPECSTPAK